MTPDATAALQQAHQSAIHRYEERNSVSKALHGEATQSFPGGNTRTVLHANPFPICMASCQGYQVVSQDGHTYTDLTGEFTAALYGHKNPIIIEALQTAIQDVGLNIGATTQQEQVFARELCQRFHLERVRFTNSGTEANLQALAAARLFTKKRRIVVFSGGYHGSVLGFVGGKPAANNVDLDDWIVARFNDLESARKAIQQDGVAAVLMEGMQGSGGGILGKEDFVKGVREEAAKAGVLFILDEVMTSRLSENGIAGIYNLTPDLRTFGKYLGGGVAFGAFGGRADVMEVFDPRLATSVAHSGTFNNNTLVTHAGHAGLTKIYTPEVARRFLDTSNDVLSRLKGLTEGTRMCFTGLGSIINSHFTESGMQTIESTDGVREVQELKDLFWLEMLEQGFWVTRRGFIALILETPQGELDRFVEAVRGFLKKYESIVAIS